jgi:hypothetical protein
LTSHILRIDLNKGIAGLGLPAVDEILESH